jgi:hypothetical protein
MLSLARPIHVQHNRVTLPKTKKHPVRNVKIRSALPNPDLANYAQLQLVTWILPMTIAGRLLKVNYPDIAIGLTVMTVAKLTLAANGIINY